MLTHHSVVFSSWTTHLDLIEIALKNNGHVYVRLDGRMSRDARDKSMRVFREDPSVRVMLVSIGAGGLGQSLKYHLSLFQMQSAATVIIAMLLLVAGVDAISFWLRRGMTR